MTFGRPAMKICTPYGIYSFPAACYLSVSDICISRSDSEFSRGIAGNAARHMAGNEGVPLAGGPISKQEILRQAHLRRHIDQLREKKLHAEDEVAKQE